MDKTKVIFYNTTLLKGGTDTYMFEVIRNIDKSKFSVDVIIKNGDKVDDFMFDELKKLGANVFLATGSFSARIKYLAKFFKLKKNYYDVAHINATSQGTGLISYFAKHYAKIPKVIFHSHMGGNDHKKDLVDKIGTHLMFKYSDVFTSCSNRASKFMYGENFLKKHEVKILKNSVDTNKFTFDPRIQEKIRLDLNIDKDTFVLLHVGRFAKQKNHKFLIDVFGEVLNKNQKSMLLLIGDGTLFDECKAQVQEMNLSDSVKFLGLKNNVNEYMQAADCFVMTSLHEGLPIVAVEAQATGLPCVLSSNISSETKLSENVEFVDLSLGKNNWAEKIISKKTKERKSGKETLTKHKFDKESAIAEIESLYLSKSAKIK